MLLTTVLFTVVVAAQASPALRIVVVEGEDAVNIVQQKTAVRPVVEVRDRNNLPVSGATVTFTIGPGQPAAFAGGVQTVTVTTNAAGQAAASGFNVLGAGSVQIQVQAAYQGQVATAAISQTNFATAAAATQAGSGAPGSSSGGGGLSATTLTIAGAAVAGGAVAATQLKKDDGDGSGRRYTGAISGQFQMITNTTSSSGTITCTSIRNLTADISITLGANNTGGRIEVTGNLQETSVSGNQCSPNSAPMPLSISSDLGGSATNLSYTRETSHTSTTPATVTVTVTSSFTGALSGETITGAFSYAERSTGTGPQNTIQGAGSASYTVTLSLR